MSDRIDLTDWRRLAKPRSKWRLRARQAIVEVVNENCGAWGSNPRVKDAGEIAKLIDDAYPFGQRSHEPYKCWLTERKLIRQALGVDAVLPAPSADEAAACMVAADLLEQTGNKDATKQLLEEQAPNRLNLKCPVCGARPMVPCSAARPDDNEPGSPNVIVRVVPHESRLGSTTRSTHIGPLFGGLT